MDISYYWGNDRTRRCQYAKTHTKEMEEKYLKDIIESVKYTKEYFPNSTFDEKMKQLENMQVYIYPENSVEAIFNHSEGKTAVLNFASYKEPGGRFIEGSRAQEESLCADSFLYNVLKREDDYYRWNKQHLKYSLYLNRALYTPDIKFFKKGKEVKCDVITCAAPNITPSRKYGWGITEEENTKVLDSRINFVLDIAEDNKVDTLILGAFGCGVFGQDATEVARIFTKYLKTHKVFKKVIFAIPCNIHVDNYNKFKKVLEEESTK